MNSEERSYSPECVEEDAFREIHTIPIDSQPVLRLTRYAATFRGSAIVPTISDCPNNLILPFPGPEKVPNPYVRGHSSIGLFLTHSVESGYRGNLIHRSIWKGRFFEVQMQEPA
jgi:hypothetical protein